MPANLSRQKQRQIRKIVDRARRDDSVPRTAQQPIPFERMFNLAFLVLSTGRTRQELETNVFRLSSLAQKHNCNLRRLDCQQEQGLISCLPLANNLIEIQRGMTTSSIGILIPFTTQELFQRNSLYYGLSALSNNLIIHPSRTVSVRPSMPSSNRSWRILKRFCGCWSSTVMRSNGERTLP